MATMANRIRAGDRARKKALEQLLVQQSELLRSRKELLRTFQPTATAGVMDSEEHSLDAEEQGVGFSVLELTSRTLQGIEAALDRMESGDSGTCADCRCRISASRLRALPFATLCLACQDARDDGVVRPAILATEGWVERVGSTRARSLGH